MNLLLRMRDLFCVMVVLGFAGVGTGLTQDGVLRVAELGECPLANGQVILDCRVGYRTFGSLHADGANAVIVPTWLNGRSEDLISLFGTTAGGNWLVDTAQFYGVAFDAFGDGVSSSPSNSMRQAGVAFPLFTMEDMVRAQYRVLTQVLGVKRVHAAVGLSMGGHQVFAWAVLYPGFVERAVPIVGSPQASVFDLLSKRILIEAIESDPEYKGGRYTVEPPLKLANAIGTLTTATPDYRNAEVPREKFSNWMISVEAPQRQDANDRVWQAKAIMTHDVLHGRSIADVAKSVPVRFLVVVAAEDRMVTPQPALDWAKAVGAETYVSAGTCAHLIMSCDAKALSERVVRFLAR
jgi:homoserine O-acetyltransferase